MVKHKMWNIGSVSAASLVEDGRSLDVEYWKCLWWRFGGHASTGRTVASSAWDPLHPQIRQIKDKINIIQHQLFSKDIIQKTLVKSTKKMEELRRRWKSLDQGYPSAQESSRIVLRWIQMDSDLMKWNRWRKKMVRNPAFVFRLGRAPFSCLPFYTRPGFSNKHVTDTAGGNSSTWGQNYWSKRIGILEDDYLENCHSDFHDCDDGDVDNDGSAWIIEPR